MPGDFVKTYLVSKGWRIAAVVASLVYIPFGFILFWLPFRGAYPAPLSVTILCFILGTVFIFSFLYLLVNSFKYRFEIWDDKIRSIGLLGVKEMRLDEIAGYECIQKANGGRISFVSEKTKGKVRVMMMFESSNEFKQWLEDNFKDLTAIEAAREMKVVLSNEKLGTNEEQRKESLQKIKRWAGLFGVLFSVFAYWGFLHPRPYGFFIWASILLPFFGAGFLAIFPGIFKFNVGMRSPFVPIDFFVCPSVVVLAGRAFFDWNILNWDSFWMPFAGFTLFLFALFMSLSRETRKKKFLIILWLIYCALYGYGASICLNGILDKNVPVKYLSKVIDKRMIEGRPPEYYMTLPSWGPMPEQREYKVYGNAYQQRAVGDSVTVSLKSGAFHIPYYFIY
jgi:hypothetical protein